MVADIIFAGHKIGTDQSRQFALERCFKLKETSEEVHCGRISDWYPECGTSCGDSAASADAFDYDGFVVFKYQPGTGVTELTVKMRPKQFFRGEKKPESIPYETQTFRLMETKDRNPVAGRTAGWEVQRKKLKECLGESETTPTGEVETTPTATASTLPTTIATGTDVRRGTSGMSRDVPIFVQFHNKINEDDREKIVAKKKAYLETKI